MLRLDLASKVKIRLSGEALTHLNTKFGNSKQLTVARQKQPPLYTNTSSSSSSSSVYSVSTANGLTVQVPPIETEQFSILPDDDGFVEISLLNLVLLTHELNLDPERVFAEQIILISEKEVCEVASNGKKPSVTFDLFPNEAYGLLEKLQALRDEFDDDEVLDTIEVVQDAVDIYERTQKC